MVLYLFVVEIRMQWIKAYLDFFKKLFAFRVIEFESSLRQSVESGILNFGIMNTVKIGLGSGKSTIDCSLNINTVQFLSVRHMIRLIQMENSISMESFVLFRPKIRGNKLNIYECYLNPLFKYLQLQIQSVLVLYRRWLSQQVCTGSQTHDLTSELSLFLPGVQWDTVSYSTQFTHGLPQCIRYVLYFITRVAHIKLIIDIVSTGFQTKT